MLALADGGFFPRTWPWAIVALSAAAAGAWLLVPARVGPLEGAFVAGLAALAAWQALSSQWAPDPARAREDAYRGAVYIAAAAASLVLARAGGPRRLLLGIVAGGAAALAYGLVQHFRASTPDPFQGDLLYQPIGYANSIGILAALVLVLALGLFFARRATLLLASAGVAVAALALTGSRASWAAAVVGAATAGVHAAFRRRLWAWLGLVGVAVVLVLVSPLIIEPARLHGLLSDRAYYWPVAWHALDSPLRGLGSGAFAQLWALERPVPVNAIDAHSLFLETLLELGVVGLIVVVATLAVPLAVAGRVAGRWAAGAAGAYTAFLVHAAVDWDWEMPVVTIAGLACGAALLAAAPRRTMPA